jgi:hypothetical protein
MLFPSFNKFSQIFFSLLFFIALISGPNLVRAEEGSINWQRILGREPDATPTEDTAKDTAQDTSVNSQDPEIVQPETPAWPPRDGQDSEKPLIDEKAKGYVKCDGTAKDAFTYIPDPFNNWFQLVCPAAGGHYIAPLTGYSWTKNSQEAFIISSSPSEDFMGNKQPSNGYFTKIGVEQLTERKRLSAAALFRDVTTRMVSSDAKKDESAIEDYWRLSTMNNKLQQIDIFLYLIKSKPKWFVYCLDNCKDYELIKVISANQSGPAGMPSISR